MAKTTFTPFAAALSARIGARVDESLAAIGEDIRHTAAESIIDGGIPSPNHIPSNPGEPPNADTHLLDQSIRADPVQNHRVEISANTDYARGLELGTSRVEPRPYMRPALAKNRDGAEAKIKQAVARAIKP